MKTKIPTIKQAAKNLTDAAEDVWKAFLKYGPVDDGRPEGDRFDASLTKLMEAKCEMKAVLKS